MHQPGLIPRLRTVMVETVVLLVGTASALVEFFVFKDNKLGFLIVVIGFLFSAGVLLIRKDIADQMSNDLDRAVARIEPVSWRNEAFRRSQELTEELREWAEGRRSLPRAVAIPHQVALLHAAKHSMHAIHHALDTEKVRLWEKATGNFRNLIEAHRQLGDRVEKRRIFVFDDSDEALVSDESGHQTIKEDWVVGICKDQMGPTEKGGLGVELRILWKSELERLERDIPPDLLIIDGTEVVMVDVGSGEYFDGQAFVNPTRVNHYSDLFENCWGASIPAVECLPAATASAAGGSESATTVDGNPSQNEPGKT